MSEPLKLPDELELHAKSCTALYNHVLNAMKAADDLIRDALYFFPEYTDHGKTHVQDVWKAAFGLIPPDARGKGGPFTPEDACILALSVLLHDIAMHLHLGGFRRLIEDKSPWRLDGEDAGAPSWAQMWRDYLIEVGRWDGERIVKVLGDGATEVPRVDLSKTDLSKPERLLVGEFLRRHHPRLAHEIARHGFPDLKGATSVLGTLDRHSADIAGLIARSHGMPLRDCLDRLRRAERHREFRGVHALYLMAVLRVADFVQLQADRAPAKTLRQIPMESPVSRLEWKTHAAILDIRESTDAEALTIEIEPEDVEALLRAKEWVEGLQEELDKSWAVLGEVYGVRPPLCQLGLRFRRVRALVADGLPFHPVHARFRLAGSDTIKLLIGPLYGHKPEVGIRELMQNAVDAVRERDCVEREDGNADWAPAAQYDVEIRIELDGDGKPDAVVVRDIGMGMTADIVLDYFLTAGATFRRSDAWRGRFEEKPAADGTPGRAKVLRTGRFGVGALAAFLIGDEIEVTTRHRDAAEHDGLQFTAHVDDRSIQLNRVLCPEVGTTIRVKVGEAQRLRVAMLLEARGFRDWDWFCHAWPRVGRVLGTADDALPQAACVDDQWWPVAGTGFDAVSWKMAESNNDTAQLICNGIRVCEAGRSGWHWRWGGLGAVPAPWIDVADRAGKLGLTLTRNSLDGGADLINAVVREVARHVIADALVNGPSERWSRGNDVSPWGWTAGGFVWPSPALFAALAIGEVWALPRSLKSSAVKDASLLTDRRLVMWGEGGTLLAYQLTRQTTSRGSVLTKRGRKGMWGLALVEELADFNVYANDKSFYPYDEVVAYLRTVNVDDMDIASVCEPSAFAPSGELAAQVWLELIGPRPIPWETQERRKQLPEAFEQLAPLIEHYAKLGPLEG